MFAKTIKVIITLFNEGYSVGYANLHIEFNLLIGDMLFFVSCKFKTAIFKIVHVMAENMFLCVPLCTEYILSLSVTAKLICTFVFA